MRPELEKLKGELLIRNYVFETNETSEIITVLPPDRHAASTYRGIPVAVEFNAAQGKYLVLGKPYTLQEAIERLDKFRESLLALYLKA